MCQAPDNLTCLPGSCEATMGSWIFDDWVESSGNCNGLVSLLNGDGTFGVGGVGADSFLVSPADGTGSYTCDVSGCGFSCVRPEITDTSEGTVTLHIQVTVRGSLLDSTRMSGAQIGSVSCTGQVGPECDNIEDQLGIRFPCKVSVTWNGHWVAGP